MSRAKRYRTQPATRQLARRIALSTALLAVGGAAAQAPAWTEIDYGPLVEVRQLTHSGDAVGVLLRQLAEHPEAPALRQLLEPWLEPYAFVLPDVIDAAAPAGASRWIELGSLYVPGGAEPAWVELLRARRFVVESDGRGAVRAFLPAVDGPSSPGATAPDEPARRAWQNAWPVLRLVLAAERQRLARDDQSAPALTVEVYAYRHHMERTTFALATPPYRLEVLDVAPSGDRPPLDLERLSRVLASDAVLEGGRLDPDGRLTLLTSDRGTMTLLGRRPTVADAAVAYRAVFHGGAAEPYMSLDRGDAPQTAVVNYGGRLRDTAIGLVSLLCDIRFKTFSLGFDPWRGREARSIARQQAAGFQTHIERFAADPAAASSAGQQTRLWFYPDAVDLTLSPQADLLALRRVRMAAASERAGSPAAAERAPVPAWTAATVTALNADYDRLASAFPELSDLDTVVRLLSLFTWLKTAAAEGLLIPDLDVLLAAELPAEPTPRHYPQQLAYAALTPGDRSPPLLFDRLDVALALDRLQPAGERPLVAERRFARALAALDPGVPDQAALAQELAALAGQHDPIRLDDAAARAERLRMHRLVLGTLADGDRAQIKQRADAGQAIRVLSLGIGGLDLGMGQVMQRAARRTLGLGGARAIAGERAAGTAGAPRPLPIWKEAPLPLPIAPTPPHGESSFTRRGEMVSLVSLGPTSAARVRRMNNADPAVAPTFERYEHGRLIRYTIARAPAGRVVVQPVAPPAVNPPEQPAIGPLPTGTLWMELLNAASSGAPESAAVRVRLSAAGTQAVEAALPRALLQRLILGRRVDLTPTRPLGGLAPLPTSLGPAQRLLVQAVSSPGAAPWERPVDPIPGEEDPARLAPALNAWWSADPATATLRAAVATDRAASPQRFATPPSADPAALLLLPEDAFPGATRPWRSLFSAAWPAATTTDRLAIAPPRVMPTLVVLVSAEAPDALALRLTALARDPALAGRVLAVLSLQGPLRDDLPGALLREGKLAALGLATSLPVGIPGWAEALRTLATDLAAGGAKRPEQLRSPFTWYY